MFSTWDSRGAVSHITALLKATGCVSFGCTSGLFLQARTAQWDSSGGVRAFWTFCRKGLLTAGSTPIAWIVDGRGLDLESLAQGFDKHLQPFCLAIGRINGSSVGYQTDADGPTIAKPTLAGNRGQLFLPFFCRLYLTVFAAAAVTQTEVAIDILRRYKAVGRGQLIYTAVIGSAVVDFDAVPSAYRWGGSGKNGVFDRVETLIRP